MSEQRLTDAQLERGLRAIAPDAAPRGLLAAIRADVETTPQDRPVVAFRSIAASDPAVRQRTLLLVAALLLVGMLAAVGVAGALVNRDPALPVVVTPDGGPVLDLSPPGDLPAFVQGTYGRMAELPPMTITAMVDHPDGRQRRRIHVGADGSVRVESYPSADAAEPDGVHIYTDSDEAEQLLVDGVPRWRLGSREGLEEDPRVFVFGTLAQANSGLEAGCEVSIGPGSVYVDPPGSRWRYVGVEDVAGRPAHHVACDGDLWIDIETGLALRSRGPVRDDQLRPIPGETWQVEVLEVVSGAPDPALFDPRPPDGVASISDEEYQCAVGGFCPQDASQEPIVTPLPAPDESGEPPTLEEVLARSDGAADDLPAFAAVIESFMGTPGNVTSLFHDGEGRWRVEDASPDSPDPPWVTVSGPDYHYATELTTDGVPYWVERPDTWGTPHWPLDVVMDCDWTLEGADVVGDRTADHIACTGDYTTELWIDRETGLIVREQDDSGGMTSVRSLVSLVFGPQPEDLFELPPGTVLGPPAGSTTQP